ncbi:methanol oxidation system protein MoxJ [Candidatus Methylospira mobilis]|uniref:Methanol oxidation system protein MoxJ n=1 Tax=Candidatus Methylospira mobilis TaxID=1808979 RepID=A0A5Q0BLF6_9GAMM|nr:methanol oxidation system protein MoxJ [Candidatus Methylospira mobilis]QFY42596.1 methanol oxidation system protein MoxJ [Candidatus Methylospira mobilis]WNV04289.1 methanol oxidation system protein MoxJ [Candidatus Methylospira mobilis]
MYGILKAGAISLLVFAAGAETAHAKQEAEPLKVCSAENELPYSNKDGSGFENKLAALIAEELGRPVENVWWTDARYFVRDLLDKKQCDVVIGVDQGDPRMLTSAPYYRSGYVFVYQADKAGAFQDWNSPALKTARRIAFIPDTPPDVMLKKIGRWNDMFNYMHSLVDYKSRRNQYVKYDPERLVGEVVSGKAEVAALWGPAAARYVKSAGKPLAMTVIPDNNTRMDGEKVPHHYSTAIGVRKDEKALLEQIDQALIKRSQDIEALLKQEGIPLLPINEAPLK